MALGRRSSSGRSRFRSSFERRGGSFRSSRGRSSYRSSSRHYDDDSELMSKLSRIGGRDSEVALEIVNAVLAAKGGDDYGPPSKMRRTERGRGGGSYRGRGMSSRGSTWDRSESRKRSYPDDDEREDKPIVPGENSDGEVAVPDKPAFEIPKAALYCRICNIYSFPSKRSYLEHRDSNSHSEMANIYHRRNVSVLRLLRGHAKVRSVRRMKDYKDACRICHGTYEDSYQTHKASLEHELVENFLKWRCCGKFFISRQEYDDHTLTPFHLVNKYEELRQWQKDSKEGEGGDEEEEKEDEDSDKKKGIELLEEQSKLADEAFEKFKEVKKEALEKAGEDSSDVPDVIPEYDSTKPIGVRFITGEKVFKCRACVVEIVGNKVEDIKSHLHSPDHYFEVLRAVQQKMALEKIKEDEENKNKERTRKGDEDKDDDDEEEEEDDDEEEETKEDEEEEETKEEDDEEEEETKGEDEEEENQDDEDAEAQTDDKDEEQAEASNEEDQEEEPMEEDEEQEDEESNEAAAEEEEEEKEEVQEDEEDEAVELEPVSPSKATRGRRGRGKGKGKK